MNKLTVAEVDAFIRQLKWLIAGVVVLFVVPLIVYAVYMEDRLTTFEDSLRYRPPHDSAEDLAHDHLENVSLNPVQGQIVYVPAYSHIYHQDGKPYLLTITLSVRNTSLDQAIIVRSVRYFDTKGVEVKSHLRKPLRLPPLATTEFLVERDDASGGSGANFLVEWVADAEVTEPIIEAVMIATDGQQGVSFVCSGRAVQSLVTATDSAESVPSAQNAKDEE
ncbi:MAG: DUF3124 domain-containing protein [Fuerstiella sp.]